MIFECALDGPDKRVCEHLAHLVNSDIVIDGVPLGNKRKLIADCGRIAANLLATGCERVVVIWDLNPPWSNSARGCVAEDCRQIRESLTEAGVEIPAIHLVCIIQELEAWLLADERAVAEVLGLPSAKINRTKKPETIADPKAHLDTIFRTNKRPPYRAHMHAHKIAKAMKDLGRLKGCPAFARFERAVGKE